MTLNNEIIEKRGNKLTVGNSNKLRVFLPEKEIKRLQNQNDKKIFLVLIKGADAEIDTTIDYIENCHGEAVELTRELEEKITKDIIKELGYTDDYDRGVIQKVFQKLKEEVKNG